MTEPTSDDQIEVVGERKARPTPTDYMALFEQCPGGPQILEELVAIFGNEPYVKGGHEADRETCYRSGQRAVIDFILDRIAKG